MPAKKKTTDPFLGDDAQSKRKSKKTQDEDDFPFGYEDDGFEYEDLAGDGELPPMPEDLSQLIAIVQEYAMSEAENALWRAYAAVEESPDLETAKKRIRALLKKLT